MRSNGTNPLVSTSSHRACKSMPPSPSISSSSTCIALSRASLPSSVVPPCSAVTTVHGRSSLPACLAASSSRLSSRPHCPQKNMRAMSSLSPPFSAALLPLLPPLLPPLVTTPPELPPPPAPPVLAPAIPPPPTLPCDSEPPPLPDPPPLFPAGSMLAGVSASSGCVASHCRVRETAGNIRLWAALPGSSQAAQRRRRRPASSKKVVTAWRRVSLFWSTCTERRTHTRNGG